MMPPVYLGNTGENKRRMSFPFYSVKGGQTGVSVAHRGRKIDPVVSAS